LVPELETYRSDASNGTFRTVRFRAAYDTPRVSGGFTVSRSPVTNGYSKSSVRLDATAHFPPATIEAIESGKEPELKEKGFARAAPRSPFRFELSGGLVSTQHSDEFVLAPDTTTATSPGRGRGRGQGRVQQRTGGALEIHETD